MEESLNTLQVTQPPTGGPYKINRLLTRSEMLELLHRCQNGEASCLYTLKVIEAHILESVKLAIEERHGNNP